MVEGVSGILTITPPSDRPLYEPSKRRLTWPNGAIATTFSADEPDRLAWVFHLVMAFAGLYLAMLCTNWGNIEAINSASGNPELSLASMWVRIASQWLIYALYGWSLIAPRVCPNRDFS